MSKKIIEINSTIVGSTGRIMCQLGQKAEQNGYCVITSSPTSRSTKIKPQGKHIYIGNVISRNLHLVLASITGLNGCFSWLSTVRFLHKVTKEKPSLIHLHNLHNCYINLPLLFKYIKKYNIPVVWTLHDCWAFTGHCPYFTVSGCDKWGKGCQHCPSYREYPSSRVDNSRYMWSFKKKWFTGVKNLNIVTPSRWLTDLVRQSFLKEYPVTVIHNGIDLEIFHPHTDSNVREKYRISATKKMILGVSFSWGYRKGLDVFIALSKLLDNQKYQIVLVGTNEEIEKQLPSNIISIRRTGDAKELAKLYSAADIFLNPTREENYPTVNMEAIACGCPVITFKTGGSPEIVSPETGLVLEENTVEAACQAIVSSCQQQSFSREQCVQYAQAFNKDHRFMEYVSLYQSALNS